MPVRPVPEQINVRYSHDVGQGVTRQHFGYSSYSSQWAVTRAALRRPARGTANAVITCGQCGNRVDFRLHDSARTRALWLLLFLLCPAIGVGLFSLLADSRETAAVLTLILGPVLLLAGAIGSAVVWRNEEGVRYREHSPSPGSHILEVGRLTAAWRH
ncbi:hypothetical protein [Streptomyces sp. NPDC059278]|uniref:hypothetical protein n=1 Tax=Streptomyces sp. NPDC059278 TaxID=3346801 RepID=UPI0036817CDE